MLAEALRHEQEFLLQATECAKMAPSRYQAPTRERLALFTSNLCTLLRTGVPVVAALEALAHQENPRSLGGISDQLRQHIAGGQGLADALAQHPRIFSAVYVGVVRAGEKSGQTDGALEDLAAYLMWQDELARQVRKATTYPLILVGGIASLIVFLLLVIAPRFQDLMDTLGTTVPASATVLFTASDVFRLHWPQLAAGLGAAIGLLVISGRVPLLRRLRDGIWLGLPVIGIVAREIALSRFARNFSVLLRAGVGVPEAMQQTRSLVGNATLARALDRATENVERGRGITDSLDETGTFPPLVITMIRVGELSGHLTETLQSVTQYYDRSVKRAIERLLVTAGPVLTVVIGILVAWIAITVFTTLYSVLGSLGDVASLTPGGGASHV